MDCPTEERLLRKALEPIDGVLSLSFDLIGRTLRVRHSLAGPEVIMNAIAGLNMSPVLLGTPAGQQGATAGPTRASWIRMGIAGLLALSAEAAAFHSGNDRSWTIAMLVMGAIALGGLDTLRKGWLALRHFTLNINLLMTVAVAGALLIGQWPEAAVVVWLFSLAEMIEARSLTRARQAIRALSTLLPESARVLSENGQWEDLPPGSVPRGATIRVRPGERIALDGIVLRGESSVDQAPITGESLPIDKAAGDQVFAGTINQHGVLECRVTSGAGHTMLDRIAHSVQEAQTRRAPTQRFIDRFAGVYTPFVFVVALLVATVAPAFFAQDWHEWIYRGLVLLVVACPCALVISTPVTIVSALTAAARRGILIKGGLYLEQGRKLQILALDKTGTLTQGAPTLSEVVALDGSGIDAAQALHLAASLSALSSHPIARAIARAAPGSPQAVQAFETLPGRGSRGSIGDIVYQLGNRRLAGELGASGTAMDAALDAIERQGKTAIILTRSQQPLAVFAVSDAIREASRAAVDDLKTLGIELVIVSGDNGSTVRDVAAQLGIADARGDLLPQDKLDTITSLRQRGRVGMVGDGVNDAPALAGADIGFAMGAAGTDTAVETADVALLDDDLRKLPEFIRLSRRTAIVLWQNILFALAIKLLFFGLTFTGHATLWMAVFADTGASLLVVLNGLRLLRRLSPEHQAIV